MSTTQTRSYEHRHYSPSASIVESSRLVPWLMLCCLVAGVALGLSIVTLVAQARAYRELEREVRLMQMQTDGMKVAMLAEGIELDRHLKGENP